jgi:hypothetical protein
MPQAFIDMQNMSINMTNNMSSPVSICLICKGYIYSTVILVVCMEPHFADVHVLMVCFSPQPWWMTVNPQSSTSVGMSFQSAPYWDVFHLFQLVKKRRYRLTCEENQRTFLELLVTKARTVAMDVGGGT